MKLTALTRKYILHWGEMGTRWGINRTVAQVHALLFVSPKPLNAEEISLTLVRGAVECQHQPEGIAELGTRESQSCPGRSARSFRDVQGCLGAFPDCHPGAHAARSGADDWPVAGSGRGGEGDGKEDEYAREQLAKMLEFFETASACYADVGKLSPATLRKLMKMGGKVSALLG